MNALWRMPRSCAFALVQTSRVGIFRLRRSVLAKRPTMNKSPSAAELEQRKRELRMRIARARRRIDERLHAIERDSRRLISWQAYISRSGLRSIESLAVHLAKAAGSRSVQTSRQVGVRFLRLVFRQARRLAWKGLKLLWAALQAMLTPSPRSQASGSNPSQSTQGGRS